MIQINIYYDLKIKRKHKKFTNPIKNVYQI